VSRTRNSKDQDAIASTRHDDADTNSPMQILKRKDAKAQSVSRKRSNPNIFGFLWTLGMKMQSRLRKQEISPINLKSDTT
jgi:hypothetical protein